MTKTTHPAKVAIIIVAWNNQDILSVPLDAAREQTYPRVDTYLIDNASKDNTVEFVTATYPEVKIIHGGSNLGFAKGNNVAIAEALKADPDYDYFVFLNSDACMKPDWIDVMVKFAEQKPTGALFQSVTLDYYNHGIIDSTHIYVSTNGQGTQGNWRNPHLGITGPNRVFGVNAAVAMMSRRFMDAQPFDYVFDDKMFMYLEDVDLAARATVMGWDNYLVSGTEAYHMGSASSGKNPGFSLYMTFRNNSAMLMKNLPPLMLLKMMPAIAKGDYYTIRHLMRLKKYDAARKVFNGRWVGIFRLPKYFSDTRKLAKIRVTDDKYLAALMERGSL